MAPTSLPSVSRKRIRVPTVGIGDFGTVMRPPLASTAAMIASTSSTEKVGSKPLRPVPVRGSWRWWSRPITPGASSVAGLDQVEARRAPGLEAPAEHGLVKGDGAVDIVGVDGEGGEIGWHGLEARALARAAAIPLERQDMTRKRRTRADEPFLLVRSLASNFAAGERDRAPRARLAPAHLRLGGRAHRLDRARLLGGAAAHGRSGCRAASPIRSASPATARCVRSICARTGARACPGNAPHSPSRRCCASSSCAPCARACSTSATPPRPRIATLIVDEFRQSRRAVLRAAAADQPRGAARGRPDRCGRARSAHHRRARPRRRPRHAHARAALPRRDRDEPGPLAPAAHTARRARAAGRRTSRSRRSPPPPAMPRRAPSPPPSAPPSASRPARYFQLR